jgi:hypothetical protein
MLSFGGRTYLMNGEVFCDFDMKKFIIDFFGNEDYVKDLVNMLFSFVLQVAKKKGNLHPLIRYCFLSFLNFFFSC